MALQVILIQWLVYLLMHKSHDVVQPHRNRNRSPNMEAKGYKSPVGATKSLASLSIDNRVAAGMIHIINMRSKGRAAGRMAVLGGNIES